MNHLFSLDGWSREQILGLLARARELCVARPLPQTLAGRVVGLLFFEPSTRTRVGFHAAVARLGGTAIEVSETRFGPGMGLAESLEDTVRVLSAYCDVLVLRHSDPEAVRHAMRVSGAPVINGGAGTVAHPTQALIDLLAVQSRFGRIDGLRYALVGNLATSRAARSLLQALAFFAPAEIRLVGPVGTVPPDFIPSPMPSVLVSQRDRLDLGGCDVVYAAGFPPGAGNARFAITELERFAVNQETLQVAPDALVLCPLPRLQEVHPAVDAMPQAGYFQQSADGVFVRMAVLEAVLA